MRAAALFFLLSPGLEAVAAPWVLTGFEVAEEWPAGVRVAGVALIAGGVAVVVWAYARLAVDGRGTPSPAAPPDRLVVAGPYRVVRHPVYLAIAAIIAGEGLVLGQPVLLAGAAVYVGAFAVWVRVREEPLMRERFGAEYDAYRRDVPAWLPRP